MEAIVLFIVMIIIAIVTYTVYFHVPPPDPATFDSLDITPMSIYGIYQEINREKLLLNEKMDILKDTVDSIKKEITSSKKDTKDEDAKSDEPANNDEPKASS